MEEAKKPSYKYCIVPKCKNTIRSTPAKVFFPIPRVEKVRKQWCMIMRRDKVSAISSLYCCEDHFNSKRARCNSDPPTPKDTSYDVEKEISLMDMEHKDVNLQEDEDPLYETSYKSEPEMLDESDIKREVPLQPDLRCQVCHSDIIGFRYTCVQCADWDMCASCEARGEHPAHYVLRLPKPKPSEECEPVIAAIREHIHNLLRLSEEITSELESNEEIFNAEIPEELFDPHLTDPLQAAVDSEVPELNICLQSSTEQDIADVQQITTSSASTEESPPPTVDAPRIVDNQTYSGRSDLAKECISSKIRLKIRAKRKQELKTRTEV